MDIYKELVEAKCKIDNWCSDLYTPVTTESTVIIERYEFKSIVTTFKCLEDGRYWFDIPFAFYPYYSPASILS